MLVSQTNYDQILRVSGQLLPIHEAVKQGNYQQVAKLLQENPKNVNLHTISQKTYVTPLHIAALYNYVNIIRLLLEKGAEVKTKAVVEMNKNVEEFYIEPDYKKITNSDHVYYYSPLHFAVFGNSIEAAKLIIEKDVFTTTLECHYNFNGKYQKSQTPYQLATETYPESELAQLLFTTNLFIEELTDSIKKYPDSNPLKTLEKYKEEKEFQDFPPNHIYQIALEILDKNIPYLLIGNKDIDKVDKFIFLLKYINNEYLKNSTNSVSNHDLVSKKFNNVLNLLQEKKNYITTQNDNSSIKSFRTTVHDNTQGWDKSI